MASTLRIVEPPRLELGSATDVYDINGSNSSVKSPDQILSAICDDIIDTVTKLPERAQSTTPVEKEYAEKVRTVLIKAATRRWVDSTENLSARLDGLTLSRLQKVKDVRLTLREQRLLTEILMDFAAVPPYRAQIQEHRGDHAAARRVVDDLLSTTVLSNNDLRVFISSWAAAKSQRLFDLYENEDETSIPEVVEISKMNKEQLYRAFAQDLANTRAKVRQMKTIAEAQQAQIWSAIQQYTDKFDFRRPELPEVKLSALKKFIAAIWDW